MSNGKEDRLTQKQQRFVDYYKGNYSEAARDAGYSSPNRRGYELMQMPKIQQAIQERENVERRPHIADRQRRQEFWTQVMEDENQKMRDRLKASENLARSEADFIERREHTGEDGGPIQHEHNVSFEERLRDAKSRARQERKGSGESDS